MVNSGAPIDQLAQCGVQGKAGLRRHVRLPQKVACQAAR